MSCHIALLRGINVGGRNMIAMADLRAMLAKLDFTGVKTLLQSGNVVFQGGRRTGGALERFLEVETEKRLKASIHYVVRAAAEWETIVAHNPFPREARSDPSHLLVMCLKDAPEAKSVNALQAAIRGPEIARADGKQLYLVYPEGIGTSKLTNAVIEKTLNTRGTARNWNTVLKLRALSGE